MSLPAIAGLPRSDFSLIALSFSLPWEERPRPTPMKMIIASILTTVLIVAMTLGAMFILVQATEYVTSLESPLHRATAMGAEMLLGVILLLGTVWLATHLAVRIFATQEPPSAGGSVV
jgi:hypothetical protein